MFTEVLTDISASRSLEEISVRGSLWGFSSILLLRKKTTKKPQFLPCSPLIKQWKFSVLRCFPYLLRIFIPATQAHSVIKAEDGMRCDEPLQSKILQSDCF